MNRTVEDEDKWNAMQESLRQSQNLAVAGQFAASIMHEINNPLEAILNLVYLVRCNSDNAELVNKYSQLIEEQVGSVVRIARQTLSFYKPPAIKEEIAAVALAEAALRIHQKSIGAKRIKLKKNLADDITIEVHPGEMLQVISNLVANAVDALPVEGTLYLRARRCCREVSLIVADDGHGIPRTIAPNIFDPFFTTKQEKGTGLGLAISKAIIEKHQGRIRARSSTRSGRSGTTFRISLPLPARSAAGAH